MISQSKAELVALRLGKLFGNLLSLEMAARLAIATLDKKHPLSVGPQLPQLTTGERVKVTPLTNGSSLMAILKQYNRAVPDDCQVSSKQIVDLRDALAHGRMFGSGQDSEHFRLLKFAKRPDAQGRVLVTLAIDVTEDWLSDNIAFLDDEISKVARFLGYKKVPL